MGRHGPVQLTGIALPAPLFPSWQHVEFGHHHQGGHHVNRGSPMPTQELARPDEAAPEPTAHRRVAYLLGAGATQGAIGHAGGETNQLMVGLATDLARRMHVLVDEEYDSDAQLLRLVNSIVDDKADFEQLITFFEDAPSAELRAFGFSLRKVFSEVLRTKLLEIHDEIEERVQELFAALIDMHLVEENPEHLAGVLSLNYDTFVERAISELLSVSVDYGISASDSTLQAIRLLKLHGSFGWSDTWPVDFSLGHNGTNWIPPGIRKAKDRYPFNTLWGMARDVLDCDVLRIIGCNLGPNDWDLVSLIFGSKFAHRSRPPMEIEVIGSIEVARRIAERFPYLQVRSLFEIDELSDSMLTELLGRSVKYERLTDGDRQVAEDRLPENAFQFWLIHKAEHVTIEVGTRSASGYFQTFVDNRAGG